MLLVGGWLPWGPGGSLRAEEAGKLREAVQSIRVADLKEIVHFLASDALEGRAAGSRGGQAAAAYLVNRLTQLGLTPAGADRTFHQPFPGNSRNILAVLPGSDPRLKDEYVLVCAHYDHVGYGNESNSYGPVGRIHNGADDNASGTGALLETAEALMKLPAPRRSVLFALWDGEEAGLLGSKHWCRQPTVPLDRIRLSINVDMLGKLRQKLEIYGVRTAPGLRRMTAEANTETRLRIDFNWDMKEDSDHYSLFERRIPSLMFHTGLHDDYHRPGDDAEKVNYEGLETASRLLFTLVRDAADRDVLPAFRAESGRESDSRRKRDEAVRPGELPPRLGVVWKVPTPPETDAAGKPLAQTKGLVLEKIMPNSAAAAAGLEPGERVLSISGYAVDHTDTALSVLLAAPSKTELEVVKAPGQAPRKVAVTLGGNPVRVGVSWQADEAEPGTARITRVVQGSPANRGGLVAGDRVHRVAGKPFANLDELGELLLRSPGPLAIDFERDGIPGRVELVVPPPAPAAQ